MLIHLSGTDLQVEIEVGDLHAITPDRFAIVARAAFHELSYVRAQRYRVPVKRSDCC